MSNMVWGQINPNFSNVNQAMANATNSISAAGDVFGKLRQSILDEEQRAIGNQFKERQAQLAEAGHELNVRKQDHTEEEAKKMHERWKTQFDEMVRQYNGTHEIELSKLYELQANGKLNRKETGIKIGIIEDTLNKQMQEHLVYTNYKEVARMSDEQFDAFTKQLKSSKFKGSVDGAIKVLTDFRVGLKDASKNYLFSQDTYIKDFLTRSVSENILGSNAGLVLGSEREQQQAAIMMEKEQKYKEQRQKNFEILQNQLSKFPLEERQGAFRFYEMMVNMVENQQGAEITLKQEQRLISLINNIDFKKNTFLKNGFGQRALDGKEEKFVANIMHDLLSLNKNHNRYNISNSNFTQQNNNSGSKKVVNLAGSEIEKKGFDDYKKQISGIADINKLAGIEKNLTNLREKTKDPEQKKLVDKYSAVVKEQAEKMKAKQQKNSK